MKTLECYRCGKSEPMNRKPYEREIAFLHHFGEERKPTCRECAKILSKEGKIPCINSAWHHVGDTCKICGQAN